MNKYQFLPLLGLSLSSFLIQNQDLKADLILDDKVPVIYENPEMGFSGKLGFQYNRDSNVTQLPDGQVQVSAKKGTQLVSLLDLGFQKKHDKKSKKVPVKYEIKLGQNKYRQVSLASRDSKNITFGLSKVIKPVKKYKILSLTTKLNYRNDFLRAFGNSEKAFETWSTGVLGVFKPKKKKTFFSDVIIPILGLDLEQRSFKSGYKFDASGRDKSTFTPSLTTIIVGMKKLGSYNSNTMAMLNLRHNSSDAPDQEYLNIRFGITQSFSKGKHKYSPEFAYTIRDQDNYQNSSREDKKFDLGMSHTWKMTKNAQVKNLFRYTKQDSNLAAFEYDNTKFMTSFGVKF